MTTPPTSTWQQDLDAFRKELAQAHDRDAQAAARRKTEQRRASADQHLFKHAMAGVTPLHRSGPQAVQSPTEPVPPIPRQRLRDEQAALQESLSDAFDPGTLLHVDEELSFRRHGIGPDVPLKLRRGTWAVQAEIDLHGLTRDEAREALATFLAQSQAAGRRCVRVIHGKGLGSPGRIPVLKTRVPAWLMQKKQVLAFAQATASQGGAGALLVLLARSGGQPP